MNSSFESTVRSILYVGMGSVAVGTLLDTVSNSISLISFKITLWGSIGIIIIWLGLYRWIRVNKPYWGNGKYRISKPNRQINLFVLGIIIVLWVPVVLNTLGIKQSSSDDITKELLNQNSKLLQLTFQLKMECENLRAISCEKIIENKTGINIDRITEISKEVKNTSSSLLDKGNAAVLLDDFKDAINWYIKAAKQGNKYAQFNLGYLYYYGIGVNQNYYEAAAWATKSAEQGLPEAQNQLGILFQQGLGVKQDINEALKWITKAAIQGNPSAQYNLGGIYLEGKIVEKDENKSFEWLSKAAQNGHMISQFNLGVIYQTGKVVKQDYNKAVEWYTKAANQGYPAAQLNLAYLYKKGLGVNKDFSKSIEWYTRAADQGDEQAQFELAMVYMGNPQDTKKSHEYLLLSAKNGYGAAQTMLATSYHHGWGIPPNYQEAAKWYTIAAQQNYPEAQFGLGELYYAGLGGLKKDQKKAIELWVKAAQWGLDKAKNKLIEIGEKW